MTKKQLCLRDVNDTAEMRQKEIAAVVPEKIYRCENTLDICITHDTYCRPGLLLDICITHDTYCRPGLLLEICIKHDTYCRPGLFA